MRSRSKALLLAGLLFTGPAFAEAPLDAPLAAQPIHKGEQAPSDGVFVPTATALQIAKKCDQAQVDRERFRKQLADRPMPSGSFLIGAAVIGFIAGVLVGGIVVAVAKK